MHAFDASLALRAVDGDTPDRAATFSCRSDARYYNAIGPFGGWIAALLLKSVLSVPQARGVPLALDALFMGAIDDGDLEARVYLLRQNRSVGFWRSEIWQAARVCAHAHVTLSTERKSITLQDARFPDVPSPDDVPVFANPRTPVPWLDRYVFKPISGLIFSRADSMDSRVWIRDADQRPIDPIALTAICDTPFPPTWIRLSGQTPVSTVTYSIFYRGDTVDFAAAGADFCLIDSRAGLARNGYVDQFSMVWSRSGRLLAQTQQMLWFADPPQ